MLVPHSLTGSTQPLSQALERGRPNRRRSAGARPVRPWRPASARRWRTRRPGAGVINVPAETVRTAGGASDCTRPGPPGSNQPTRGWRRRGHSMLELVRGPGPTMWCCASFSGGGSAPSPPPRRASPCKTSSTSRHCCIAVRRHHQRDELRPQALSAIKGGRLAQAFGQRGPCSA